MLHGSDPAAKAILLLGHLDVVEAKREDWARDPFIMIEANGYFYGRGTNDMKAQDAVWVDNLVRFREEDFRPKRLFMPILRILGSDDFPQERNWPRRGI